MASTTISAAAHELEPTIPQLAPVVTQLARLASRRYQPDPTVDADDLAQEMWLRLLSRRAGLPRFESSRSARTYLARVADSVALSLRRARGAKRRGGGENVSGPPTPEDQASPHDLERDLLQRERLRAAQLHLWRITPPHLRARNAAVLRWVWVDGRSAREVSDRLGGELGPSTVTTMVFRARRAVGSASATI